MTQTTHRRTTGRAIRPHDQVTNPDLTRGILGPVVYIILTGGCIKIGHTKAFADRMRHYPDFTPRHVLHVEPGTYADELALHHRFAPFRAHGKEYYAPAPHLLRYINERRAEVWSVATIDWALVG